MMTPQELFDSPDWDEERFLLDTPLYKPVVFDRSRQTHITINR